ncbi:hypothetical protein [Novosphingobium sp. JCM 18896]|uniref:hypothetical protein n=1 Tax=Novosphingobium sp. JCM 18896 TaxID=2989731 RepID=UPI0022223720|nr:hypothetical protein [Novosphingobium sp. JCM 18896]MCW1431317.1 hypothetical protein [Novosphingobium sp. JCM 18896]
MRSFQAVLLAGGALLASAGAAQAADPQWHTTIVEMPDGSDIEIQYVGDIEPRVRVAMPVVQGASPAAVEPEGTPIAYGGIPRARRVIQPPTPGVSQYAPQYAAPVASVAAAPQFVIAGDQPKGSTYEYTLITTGADGKVCQQRTEWTSQGKNKEPRIKRVDSGEGCAGLIAPPPVSAPAMPTAPQGASPRIVPVDPNSI